MQQFLTNHYERVWLIGMLVGSFLVALLLVWTIPVVHELPKGTDTALKYVVNTTVARFGVPVAFFLMLSAIFSGFGHNKGTPRDWCEFAAKLCNMGAALFSFWAVTSGLLAGAGLSH
jgi:hypothetical protein